MAVARAVQFVQTSRRTAMIVLMSSAGTMKTRVFHRDFDLTPEILRIFFRVLNERPAGARCPPLRRHLSRRLGASLGEMMLLMSARVDGAFGSRQRYPETEVCLDGQVNLLFYPEYGGERALEVMRF